MITCRECNRLNQDTARVCANCGSSLWLTGQTTPLAGDPKTRPAQSQPQQPPPSAFTPPVYSPPVPLPYQPPAAGFRCPFCQTTLLPVASQQISTAGWVTFAVLLFTCLPLFWIGLLMKEEQRHCRQCGMRLG